MHHYCTYFDRNYLSRGIALYHSLDEHCSASFTLWVLCFDSEVHDVLSRLQLPHMRLITEQEFELGDERLVTVQQGRSRVEYYWTCTPSLPLYLLQEHPDIQMITYLDADVYFFSDPTPLFVELGGGSILMTEHRYSKEYVGWGETAGKFNVQFLIFRRDNNGLACLHWWRDRCLEWCYDRNEEGRFGDQKYLDQWPSLFEGIVVTQLKGAGLAPWNMSRYHVQRRRGYICVDDEPLIFFHYHGLKLPHPCACLPNPSCRSDAKTLAVIYYPYLQHLREAEGEIRKINPQRCLSQPHSGFRPLMRGLLHSGWLLDRYQLMAQLAWWIASVRAANEQGIDTVYRLFAGGRGKEAQACLRQLIWRNPLVLRRPGMLAILFKTGLSR